MPAKRLNDIIEVARARVGPVLHERLEYRPLVVGQRTLARSGQVLVEAPPSF
jgi:hypothetical protein